MRLFRAAALLALSLGLALAASACGNSSGQAAAGGAEYAPASTSFFVTLNTDAGGDQWQAAEALLEKFPDGRQLIDKFLDAGVTQGGKDFETDIQPALGPEVDLAGLDLETDGFVVLTQPADPAKLQELVASGDTPGVAQELDDGWWAAAQSQQALDAFNEARETDGSLADDDAYRAATDDLFDDALATAYVDTKALGQATENVPGAPSGTTDALTKCLGRDDSTSGSFALAVRAEENGVRIAGDVASAAVPVGDDNGSDLDEFFRSGALAFAATSGIGDTLRQVVGCLSTADPETAQTLAQIQLGLGITIDGDIAGLFDGATGVAVYTPMLTAENPSLAPAVVVATEVSDEDEAMDLLDRIAERAGGLMALMGEEAPFSVTDADIAGLTARAVVVDGKPVAYFGVLDGKLVASNSQAALEALPSGSSLAEDPAYTAARDAAGVPDDAAAVAYVNLEAVTALAGLDSRRRLVGVPGSARRLGEPRAAQVALLLERRARRRLRVVRRVPPDRLGGLGGTCLSLRAALSGAMRRPRAAPRTTSTTAACLLASHRPAHPCDEAHPPDPSRAGR